MNMKIQDENHMDKLLKVIQELNSKRIKVGVLGSKNTDDLVEIAYANEFGADIKPKNKSSLVVPINPKAHFQKPSNFSGLFRLGNTRILGIKKGKRGTFESLFIMVNEVHIPERSFIRSAYDSNKEKIINYAKSNLNKVFSLEITPDEFYNNLGAYCVGIIKKYMRNLENPEDSDITKKVKGSDDVLKDIGRLINNIAYEIVEG